ncbi:hypothetical protein JCM17960_08080 [Magnetospira thiophila]
MDLLDFEGQDLCFDDPSVPEVEALILRAADLYPSDEAEVLLKQAHQMAPRDLSVFVALYRYYYYRHHYDAAFSLAEKLLRVTAGQLNLPTDWRALTPRDIAVLLGGRQTLLRFHLLALKGSGYLLLRLGRFKEALERLDKIKELDDADRLGAAALAATARATLQGEIP